MERDIWMELAVQRMAIKTIWMELLLNRHPEWTPEQAIQQVDLLLQDLGEEFRRAASDAQPKH